MNIATLGTAAAVLLALPVAFLAARNITFNRGTYLLARLLIVVSRSVDSSCPQVVLVVAYRGYAFLVPSIEESTHHLLKTIIPSRKATRDYLGTEGADEKT